MRPGLAMSSACSPSFKRRLEHHGHHVRHRFDKVRQCAAAADDRRGLTALNGRLAQRRQIENAFQHLDQDPQAVIARLAKGDELPQGIDAAEAAVLTFRIAERLYTAGRWDLADKVFELLVRALPGQPAGPLGHRLAAAILAYPARSRQCRWKAARGAVAAMHRRFARQIETAQPDLFASPAIRYPLAAVYRRQEQDAQAERLYVLDRRGVDRDAWWNAARGERWLLGPQGPAAAADGYLRGRRAAPASGRPLGRAAVGDVLRRSNSNESTGRRPRLAGQSSHGPRRQVPLCGRTMPPGLRRQLRNDHSSRGPAIRTSRGTTAWTSIWTWTALTPAIIT